MRPVRLTPVCKASRRLCQGEAMFTTEADTGGPSCPFCHSPMVPTKGQPDPHVVQCADGSCVAFAMPWQASVPALAAAPIGQPVEVSLDD